MRAIRTTTRVLVMGAGLTVAAMVTAPVASATPGHTSCRAYGALTVSEAHDKTLASELLTLPHGTVDDLVAVVQVGGTFAGNTVPAFCVLK